MAKTIDRYGVQLTTEQGMILSKYLSNKGIAMNTKTPDERKKIVLDWLKSLKPDSEPITA